MALLPNVKFPAPAVKRDGIREPVADTSFEKEGFRARSYFRIGAVLGWIQQAVVIADTESRLVHERRR